MNRFNLRKHCDHDGSISEAGKQEMAALRFRAFGLTGFDQA
jgi:hypothetical protein